MRRIYSLWLLAVSLLVMLFGLFYCLRCLIAGKLFGATLFAVIGYYAGYRLLLKTSVSELRFNRRDRK